MSDQRNQDRKILHVDLDAFYASVEQRDNPALRGKPVVVGGDPHGRGVVATASYEARAFGIHSAQSCYRALQLCPQAIFLRPRFDVYRAISQHIQAIYQHVTPLVEPLALDEAYLDVSAFIGESGSATQIARAIKQEIFQHTGLTASAGVSYSKFLAKVASAYRKPDGLTVIPPQAAPAFLGALPVGKFFGVGDVTEARFKALGITTGEDLRQVSLQRLQELLGKRGTMLYRFVRGEDDRPVEPERVRKSVGKETTFSEDVTDRAALLAVLEHLTEQVVQRLLELEIAGKTVTLKLRWHDFHVVTRAISASTSMQDAHTMMRYLRPLLDQVYTEHKPVRLLGVTISNLVAYHESRQQEPRHMRSLWDMGDEETSALEKK